MRFQYDPESIPLKIRPIQLQPLCQNLSKKVGGGFRAHALSSSESLVKRATNIARPNLISLGTCIGKYTHGGNFHLTVQALSLLASNAKHKVWLKPQFEMSFLFGNHVLKSALGRITENTVPGDGVVVFSMADVPLGFTQDCRKLDPNGIVVLHQAEIGG